MYADTVTGSMERAIGETNRRRRIQARYNEEHGIVPKSVVKGVRDVIELGAPSDVGKKKAEKKATRMSKKERESTIERLEREMREAARRLEFEQAAYLRDKIRELREEK